ncbi:homeobox-DDT domain protein RLT2 isoform X2 [Ricinus communis]|uniref:Homeobox protein, putative n=1 Tax=Ricinus communis TaxID=3988 RepID=B9RVT3_RICCO|nr:homeobox-DDT domain protein RLT2 isoform X2 [Ricinus communis]EEF44370.1 homeobox protein, putative [Ricinus communis]|eukprot:XP_002517852.1 homeobox-DDT domain protein RLT2 isoform X2 [Ricinus communis]
MEAGGSGGGGSEGEKKKPPEGEVKSKRKMKTASQLEILEKTYAVETYPSEELRAELSAQLGLTDRQLQMWFCHRRLKDRKGPPVKRQRKDESPAPSVVPGGEVTGVAAEVRNELLPMPAAGSSPFGHGMDSRRVVARTPGVAVARISSEMSAIKRYYEPQQAIAELRAIAFVEAQLGEPLREDGPILGMEFDPLPPDAFGAPIATVGQQKQPGRPYEANLYERPDVKTIKGTRPVHEYQFLPQQPTVRADAYERVTTNYHYGSPADSHNTKTAALSTARPFVHANEQVSSGYSFPSQLPSLNLMPQEGRQGHLLSSATGEYDTVLRKSSLTNIGMDAHPINALDNPFMPSDKRVAPDEDVLRIERKRKIEEARIAREVEAHEKRIRKELEKQDVLRRKREEQIKKEMERHDRERRKEEERLLREKQREEERYQREQRRELERRERYLQKEFIRAEKMRQKEELRREKEAARQKAATERAIARRIAKESMELVDDERLELMELAASSKGLPSVASLDFETLQNLDTFRDKLAVFPPKSVLLKKPFSIQPWNDSEENVGNLLMVWRFLITFADVLGMWPFTLDEFVQAFHDFDPRLLGEMHVALLRTIIKDIEDVARTPATGLGANQNSAANPGGGHPQIVEGAYAWGFDICSWQRHLNPLTWPEILRQFALSAGFGPQLKKRNVEQAYHRDENEGNDGEDVITNLRNGSAVENAVAIMQERGFSNPRRSRHRLTPGTVKFAAFHVLSLEGSKGLTILEVAEKIQKSGLRDLTTSKTPEASIAAALSRDSKLFERTAPSTYCVRPAYRKDPTDAEAILSAARERIRTFTSGFVDGEDADDAERDDDSESDVADDPDIEDLGTDLNPKTEASNSPELSKFSAKTHSENGNEGGDVTRTPQVRLQNLGEGLSLMHSDSNNEVKGVASSIDHSVDVGIPTNIKQEDADIDESNLGEPWVQGLIEGEYSDLSVEERLNAFVALIGVAIEGNSIRVVLEERLEAANALKKQIWAEAQLDKRRMKEEYVTKMHYPSFTGNKVEPNLTTSTPEARQSPSVTANEKVNEMLMNGGAQQEQSNGPQNDMNYLNNIPSEGNLQMQDLSAGPDNLLYMQPGLVADKSRSQLKSFIGHKAEEMYVYRSLPLGQDRRRNRYWQFTTSNSCNDPGCGRIFVELRDGRWRLVDSEKDFDSLLTSLDARGVRESHLHMMLQKIEMSFKEAVRRKLLSADMERQSGDTVKAEAGDMVTGPDCHTGTDSPSSTVCIADSDVSETSTSFAVELGRNESERNQALRRYQDFEKWMWKECFNGLVLCASKYGKKRSRQLVGVCDYCHGIYFSEDDQCPCSRTCEKPGSDLNFSKHMVHCEEKSRVGLAYSSHASSSPLRIRLLKMQLALIEVSLLQEALQPVWTNGYRKSWGMRLQSSLSAEDLLQVLTLLEVSIKRDYLSSKFETTSELLGSIHSFGSSGNDSSRKENVPVLPWLPRTTAAVALRVMEFDSSISYTPHQKMESQKDRGNGDFIKLPSKFAIVKNTQDNEATRTHHKAPHKAGLFQEDNWADVGIGSAKLARGRASRGRGRSHTSGTNSRSRAGSSRSESGKRSLASNNNRSGQVLSWKGQSRARGGRKRGRRSVRSRQKPVKRAVDVAAQTNVAKEIIYEKVPTKLEREDWNIDETRFQSRIAENLSSSERSEYDDENGQATGDEYDDLPVDDYTGGFNGKSDDLLEGSDYNMDPNEEEDDEDDDEADLDEDDQGDLDVEGYINGDSNDDGIRDGDGEQNGDPDEGTGSSSSDFSD